LPPLATEGGHLPKPVPEPRRLPPSNQTEQAAIAPGAFASDVNRAAREHGDVLAKRIPAQRIGTDEDMAGLVIYLASRAGDYVVGNTIAVDGGVVYADAGLEIAG
jgi:NAD(P)-dependent dehydrogenase (short-subunit alcohol dehydrogenase family)